VVCDVSSTGKNSCNQGCGRCVCQLRSHASAPSATPMKKIKVFEQSNRWPRSPACRGNGADVLGHGRGSVATPKDVLRAYIILLP
jgi:hypothetical protein